MFTLMPTTTSFGTWLERKFLQWQDGEGGRKALYQFADYLGVKQPTLSRWINGRRTPEDDNTLARLAYLLGDEIYDILNRQKPDTTFSYVQYKWAELTQEQRRAVSEQIKRYLSGNNGY